MGKFKTLMAGLVLAALAVSAQAANVPNQMTYQGRLKESGTLVTGPRSVEIWLCNLQTGGVDGTNCFSASGAQNVSVQNGLFRSTYTPHSSVNLENPPWFLEVRVGPVGGPWTPLSPREALTTVPYALVASSAAGITGNAFSIGVSTFVVKEGRIGIGTTNPFSTLQVESSGSYLEGMFLNYNNISAPAHSLLGLMRARGAQAAPSAVLNGDWLGEIGFGGYDGSDWWGQAGFRAMATENWTPAALGAKMSFLTTPNGTVSEVERMTIGQDGNVGIGTTSPGYQLQLSLDSAAKPTSNTWTIASDRRVKKDITPFTDGLEVVKKINPIRYRLNGKAGLPEGAEGISVVAQDVKDAIPYAVSTYKAKLEPSDAQETDIYNFNSSPLTFLLINAVKELKAENEALRARVLKLETESR